MDEIEYVEVLWGQLQARGRATEESFSLVAEALEKYPTSTELWILRGMLIQLADEGPFELEESLESFETAASLDPTCGEAFERIGNYYDVYSEDLPKAEEAYRRAIALGGGEESYYGLARVLAQMNRAQEGLNLLAAYPFGSSESLAEIEREIRSGMWTPSE
jgi:tetratricopeptide (TPR) repeat protein